MFIMILLSGGIRYWLTIIAGISFMDRIILTHDGKERITNDF